MSPARRVVRFGVGFLLGILTGLVVVSVWLAVTGWGLRSELSGFQSSTQQIRSAAAKGDFAAAAAALPEARADAATLNDTLSSVPWSWAQGFPVVGGTVTAGATLANAADTVLAESEGIGTAMQAAASAGGLLPAANALQQITPQLTATATAAQTAAAEVAGMDTERVLPLLQTQVEQQQQDFLRVMRPLAQGAATAEVLPAMLGLGQPTKWLVVLSQPAEARGSGGGFFGAFANVDVANGSFSLRASAPNGPETRVQQDLSALPEEYQRLWGSDAQYLWGYNLTRHYPFAAQVAHQAIDPSANFVVSLDPRAVAALMNLTGPLTVDGNKLSAANAEDFFTRDIYIRYPDAAEKDAVTLEFLEAMFGALQVGALTPTELWSALGPVTSGQHVQVWSPDPVLAETLLHTPLGAGVPDTETPWVTAAFNNTAGNKIDSFVDSTLTYQAVGSCDAVTTGELTATLTLDELPPGLPGYISGRNDRPDAPYGTSSMWVHLYGPPGASLKSFTVDGQELPIVQGMERGHPVWGSLVQLPSNEAVTVRATFDQSAFVGQKLQIVPQPMVRDTVVTIDDQRTCS